MVDATCIYFLRNSLTHQGVGFLWRDVIVCNNYPCVYNDAKNGGKFFSAHLGCETSFCNDEAYSKTKRPVLPDRRLHSNNGISNPNESGLVRMT